MRIPQTTPIRRGDLARIEEAIGASRKGTETLAAIGLMRDALLKGSEVPELRWAQLHPLPDGGARLEMKRHALRTEQNLEWGAGLSGRLYVHGTWGQPPGPGRSRYAGPPTMSWLRPLRGLPDEHVFPGREGRPVSASAVGGRIRAAAAAAGLEGSFGAASPLLGMLLDLAAAGLAPNIHGVRQLHLGRPSFVALCMMAGCPEPAPPDGSPMCGGCREWVRSDAAGAFGAEARRSCSAASEQRGARDELP